MSIHVDQLPASVRRKLDLGGTGRTKPRLSRAGLSDHEFGPGHCGCGQGFDCAADWLRHAKATGCRHWRLDLPIPAPQETR